MRSAIVSFIMVVVMAGAVTAQEWERTERVDPITDIKTRMAQLDTDIMPAAIAEPGQISVSCGWEHITDGLLKAITVRSNYAKHRRLLDNFKNITIRWDSDEPEIQLSWMWEPGQMLLIRSKGTDNKNSLIKDAAVNELITNILQKDRLVIRVEDARGANVTHVFDIGNADTKETMDWVMEKCNVGNAIDSTTSTDDTPATFLLTNQDMYVIGLVGLFVVGLIVARRYRNRPRW